MDPGNRLDMDGRQEKLLETGVFLAKLLLAGLVFRLVLFLHPDTTYLQAGLAAVTAELLGLAGIEAVSRGLFVFTDQATYVITQDCLGWKSLSVFVALVLASPKKNGRILVWGSVLLVAANLVRILTTVYLAHIGVPFDLVHGILWKWGLTALVLGAWFYWLSGGAEATRFYISGLVNRG